ncbi:MAG TPA: hypothetical protein VFU31_16525 [Candidatus Binatia bacterium]|nr:hypothetical protein [Candidatus Binatia bacterium]
MLLRQSEQASLPLSVMGSLIGHIVYGAILGAMAGERLLILGALNMSGMRDGRDMREAVAFGG